MKVDQKNETNLSVLWDWGYLGSSTCGPRHGTWREPSAVHLQGSTSRVLARPPPHEEGIGKLHLELLEGLALGGLLKLPPEAPRGADMSRLAKPPRAARG
jgi:hypothetical protein